MPPIWRHARCFFETSVRSQLPQYRAQVLHRLPRLRQLDNQQAGDYPEKSQWHMAGTQVDVEWCGMVFLLTKNLNEMFIWSFICLLFVNCKCSDGTNIGEIWWNDVSSQVPWKKKIDAGHAWGACEDRSDIWPDPRVKRRGHGPLIFCPQILDHIVPYPSDTSDPSDPFSSCMFSTVGWHWAHKKMCI